MAEQGTRTRVLLIGGDARTLRSLRLFLDALGVFEAVAVATGGAGFNAMTRQPWAAVVMVDDLNDMLPEQVIAAAREAGVRAPVLALGGTDRGRTHALYAAGVAEVVPLGAAPTPEVARALGRTIERGALLERIELLETELRQRRTVDDESGLYPSWRFDEDWRLEQARARRRIGDLTMLATTLESVPDLALLPDRDRITLTRQAGRILRGALREGDIACHDGGGRFRILLVDVDSSGASDVAARISQALRQAFSGSPIPVAAAVHLADAFEGTSAHSR